MNRTLAEENLIVEYSFARKPIVGGIGADWRYWESLEEGVFRMCRCASCQTWMWPALWRCPECGGWEQEWVETAPRGTVYSWTRSWYAFDPDPVWQENLPYVVVLAELPHVGRARVIGLLDGDDTQLRIGAPVSGRIAPPESLTKDYATIRWHVDG